MSGMATQTEKTPWQETAGAFCCFMGATESSSIETR